MTAVDTSVVVAGFGDWHEHFEAAHTVLAQRPQASEHVLLEAYATLTGLPAPYRATAEVVRDFLQEQFLDAPLRLDRTAFDQLFSRTSERHIVGGALYDALIGLVAKHAGETLLTLDQRAVRTYRLLDVEYELIA